MSSRAIANLLRSSAVRPPARQLTEREIAVLEALGRGEPLQVVAQDLGLGISTVYSYRRRACEKLGVDNRFEVIRRWWRIRTRTPENLPPEHRPCKAAPTPPRLP